MMRKWQEVFRGRSHFAKSGGEKRGGEKKKEEAGGVSKHQ
jgi:hypothetical protein